MTKRFALVLVALLVVPMLLTACGSESRDTAEDYINALLKGDVQKAQDLACESFKDETAALAGLYAAQAIDKDSLDLKFDVGKGQNQEEIIVTGSYNYGPADNLKEYVLSERNLTRIVLWMEESDGEWCVTDRSVFEGMEPEEASEPAATEEPAEAE